MSNPVQSGINNQALIQQMVQYQLQQYQLDQAHDQDVQELKQQLNQLTTSKEYSKALAQLSGSLEVDRNQRVRISNYEEYQKAANELSKFISKDQLVLSRAMAQLADMLPPQQSANYPQASFDPHRFATHEFYSEDFFANRMDEASTTLDDMLLDAAGDFLGQNNQDIMELMQSIISGDNEDSRDILLLKLKILIDQRSELIELISSILKAVNETAMAVVRNMRP